MSAFYAASAWMFAINTPSVMRSYGLQNNCFSSYQASLARAIHDDIPMEGYFCWSLMDNFEWAHGYSQRFGIVYVDFETQKRIIKDSGWFYRQVISAKSVDE
jgi:beta-glucosidase/6-phospho-beta-glucosidase/beta-galactosidase